MASMEETLFYVDDVCTSKSDETAVGYIERTNSAVETHQPYPRAEFGKIYKHRAVPREMHTNFLRDGVPPKGYVLMQWQTDGKAELVPCDDLTLLDRTFMSGDLVRQGEESGTVISTRTRCSLLSVCDVRELKSGKVMKAAWLPLDADEEPVFEREKNGTMLDGIRSSELKLATTYNEGDIIIYKNWIGRIKDCFDEVTVRLADSGVVTIEDESDLKAVNGDPDERFSVGSLIKTKKGVLRTGRWVFGQYSPNTAPVGVVVDVKTKTCQVDWLHHRVISGTTQWRAMPEAFLGLDELESDEVRLYDVSKMPNATIDRKFTNSRSDPDNLQGGIRVRFKDIVGASEKYDDRSSHGKLERIPRTDTLGYDMNVYTITNTTTEVDILWSDLTFGSVMATSVVIDSSVDDEDAVFTGEIVCSNETRTPPEGIAADWAITPAKVGIAERVNAKDKIAHVRWFRDSTLSFIDKNLITAIPSTKIGTRGETVEEVSFYDVRAPKSVNRDRGDFVLLPDLPGLDDQTQPGSINWFGEIVDLDMNGKCTVRLGAAEPVKEIECDITDTMVAFAEDMAESVGHNSDPDGFYDSMAQDDLDFEMEDFEDEPWYEEGEDIPIDDADGSWSTESEGSDHDDDAMSTHEDPVTAPQPETHQPSTLETGPTTEPKSTPNPAPVAELHLNSLPNAPSPYEILETEVPTSHHFADQDSAPSSAHMKSVQKEHKILGAAGALPEGVYVRTWESRMDLIRVLFVGPLGTPYEYAPFMMDLYLPPHYPYDPPKAFFHSWTAEGVGGSGRVNPNLYEEGKICLSLLGTWQGDETRNEGWSPNKSTVLQVLVSILGLVLVKEPYYNEAGYETLQGLSSSRQNSSAYTERTYLRARAFLISPITRLQLGDVLGLEGFQEVLHWLYTQPDGARLLDKAIEACKSILGNSEGDDVDARVRDGLFSVSRGAALPLKRATARLEDLARNAELKRE